MDPRCWTMDELLTEVGGLSDPSKMPCHGYSLTALDACPLGRLLAKLPGSACSDCYALKGRYVMPNVKAATDRRLARVRRAMADSASGWRWVASMAELLRRKLATTLARIERGQRIANDGRYFRWHDAGDLLGLEHLRLIARVAILTPDVTFWLPTREVGVVAEYLRTYGPLPANLRVRLSVPRRDEAPTGLLLSLALDHEGIGWSGIHETREAGTMYSECPAPLNEGACGDCRRCWNPDRWTGVSYAAH